MHVYRMSDEIKSYSMMTSGGSAINNLNYEKSSKLDQTRQNETRCEPSPHACLAIGGYVLVFIT